MTILEELIDLAMCVCEKSRNSKSQQQAYTHSRSAVLLCSTGKAYTGCDVHLNSNSIESSQGGVSAERAAFLAAVADGASKFDCLVICSDTMKSFPSPDGLSREFMRTFGIYPVILVNCNLETKYTSSQELYPMNTTETQNPSSNILSASKKLKTNKSTLDYFSEDESSDMFKDLKYENDTDIDVMSWSSERVNKWLVQMGLNECYSVFQKHLIDGPLLLQIDENFARETLDMKHALQRRKLIRAIQSLKQNQAKTFKEKTLDEMDEYVMLLETHRITLVAKLKSIFDRFDTASEGQLNGAQVEQMLVYMNRPIASTQVHSWLNKLKDENDKIEFAEFVAQYSSLFAGEDPDIPIGDKPRKERDKSYSDKDNFDKKSEKWFDNDDDDDDHLHRNDLKFEDKKTVRRDFEDKNISDLKALAELKSIFDRFAVDNAMTAPETCQALTEAGIIAPRKDIAQYLRTRKHLGISRTVDYFEFARAYAAIRGPIVSQQHVPRRSRRSFDEDDDFNFENSRKNKDISTKIDRHGFKEGMRVEARYQGHGAWYIAKIRRVNHDGSIDVVYEDGEAATGLLPESIREYEEGMLNSFNII